MIEKQIDPANLLPGEHAPVPTDRDSLLIEALRTSNRMGVLLNEIAAWAYERVGEDRGTHEQASLERLGDLVLRRFSDCSAVHLFIAAANVGIALPADLVEPESGDWADDDE